MKKALNYGLYLLVFAVLGFSREFLFVNMNNQLYKLYYGNSKVPLPSSIRFIEAFDYTTLYYLKYPLTLAYYLAYFLTSYFAVKTICGDKKFSKWITYIYAILLILSCVSMAYNYIMHNQLNGDEYTFSRWLMGIAQSPLVAFFVIASGALYQKFKTDH